MEEKYEILNGLKKRAKPSVDAGFFESFLAKVLALISKDISSDTSELGLAKTKKPNVPDGFFENFSDKFMQKIHAEEEEERTILEQLVLRAKPKVPVGYFDNFEVERPTGRLIQLKYLWAAVSIAAVFTLLLWVISDPVNGNGTDEYAVLENEAKEELLAYSHESEIIDYIIENDIEIDLDGEQEVDEEDLFDFYGSDFNVLTEDEKEIELEEEEDDDLEDLFDFYGSDLDILTEEEKL
jgi:hypothetical protein